MKGADHHSKSDHKEMVQKFYRSETYFIKFKDDPTLYIGIFGYRKSNSIEEDAFLLKILEPHHNKAITNKQISDIVFLERNNN
ncbi:MAG: hypothetical protein P8048_01405 [Calditrichia bacterium]|jgi:hypothetical protein